MKRSLPHSAFISFAASCVLLGNCTALAADVDGHLRAAQAALSRNDPRSAEIELHNAQIVAPRDVGIRLQLATAYLRLNNPNAAEAELYSAKTLGAREEKTAPLLAQALYNMGDIGGVLKNVPAGNRNPAAESVVRTYRGLAEAALGDLDVAKTMVDDAIRLDPKAIGPKLALARWMLSRGQLPAAAKQVAAVLAAAPGDSAALTVDGMILRQTGDNGRALARFNTAIAKNPFNNEAVLDRAALYIDRGEFVKAAADINLSLAIAPKNAQAVYLSASIDAKLGDFQDADSKLQLLRGVMDRMPDAYLLAGTAKLKLGQVAEAEDYLGYYIAQRPNETNGYVLMAALAKFRGDTVNAVALLQRARSTAPGDEAILLLLVRAYIDNGNLKDAGALLETAVKADAANLVLRTQLALVRFALGDRKKALADMNAILASNDSLAKAGPPYVVSELRTGHAKEASAVVDRLVKQMPKNPEYWQLRAAVHYALHDRAGAETMLVSVVARWPDYAVARHDLARLYLESNREALARQLYQDRISKHPQDVDAIESLVAFYVREKDYAGTRHLLDRLAQLLPAELSVKLQVLNLLELEKNWPEALSLARRLAPEHRDDARALEGLARVQHESGRLADSLATYKDGTHIFADYAPLWGGYGAALAAGRNYPQAIEAIATAAALAPSEYTYRRALAAVVGLVKGPSAAAGTLSVLAKPGPADRDGIVVTAAAVVTAFEGRAGGLSFLERAMAHQQSSVIAITLSDLYWRNNDPDRAITVLEGWTKAHPADTAVRSALAMAYARHKSYALAQTEYETLAAQRSADPMLLNDLAWVYGHDDDPRALATAERAYRLAPSSPAVADTLGSILVAQGKTAAGLKYLQVAAKALPEDGDVQYNYAMALQKYGRTQEAYTIFQGALRVGGNFDNRADAERAVSELQRASR